MPSKPKYSAEEEQDLMTRLWTPALADDPEKFVLFVFPWGQAGTPLEHFQGPRRWQRGILRQMAEHIREGRMNKALGLMLKVLRISRVSGRGIGKSALVAWIIIWFLSTRIGASVIVSANTESQLRTVTWGELAKWVALAINSHWWDLAATSLTPQGWLADLVENQLQKGTRQWSAQGKLWSEENPDGYAGPHNMEGMMVIFDEASGIPDAIWDVANGYFTEPIIDRYWLTFSQGRRNTGYFYDCHNGKKADFWDTEAIDAREVEGSDHNLYDEIIAENGEDSNQARVEVYGGFPSENDEQVFSPHVVDEAMRRPPWNDPTAPLIMGIDPARGGDKTVIRLRRGRDLVGKRQFNETDTMVIVSLIIEAIQEFSPDSVVLDEGGLGYGILDRLLQLNYRVQGFNFGWKSTKPRVYANRRAQVYMACREWIKTASIPPDPKLKKDLLAIKKAKPTTKGQTQLVPKEDMPFSPDDADALVMTFAFPVAPSSAQVDRVSPTPYSDSPRPTSWMGH